jgi:hypothetical protein
MWKIGCVLTCRLVKVNFPTLRIHFLKFICLLSIYWILAKSVAQSISCLAKISKKPCLVVLIILGMLTRTPITSLVLQISFTQYSLPDSMSNNPRQLSVRNNVWPLVLIPRIYWFDERRTESENWKTRDCENVNFTRSLPSCRDLICDTAYVPERTAGSTKNLSKDSRSTGRYLNPWPPEFEEAFSAFTLMTVSVHKCVRSGTDEMKLQPQPLCTMPAVQICRSFHGSGSSSPASHRLVLSQR